MVCVGWKDCVFSKEKESPSALSICEEPISLEGSLARGDGPLKQAGRRPHPGLPLTAVPPMLGLPPHPLKVLSLGTCAGQG